MRKLIFILIVFPLFLQSQVVSYYPLTSNSNDALGINNLTDANTPTYTALGVRGTCATYNGTNQASTKASVAGFSNGDVSVTVEMWVKCSSSSGVHMAGGISCNNSAYNSSMALVTYSSSSGVDCATYGGDIYSNTYTFTTLNNSTWHQFVITRTAGGGTIGNSIRIYIDGNERSSYSTTGTNGNFSLVAYWISLGDWCNIVGAYQYGYAGNIDEVKLYKSLLSPVQIKQNYNLIKGFL